MNTTPSLQDITRTLLAPHKGIFAVDESAHTMQKRLALADIAAGTPEDGDRLREMLFAVEGLSDYISGAILHESSLTRAARDGTPLADLLRRQGVLLGVKVDAGRAPLSAHNTPKAGDVVEQVSRGLDTLDTRLADLYAQGIRFTKWRSVFTITDTLPSAHCISANAHVLAQYASIVQAHNMVPIVEPEVLYSGTHTLARSEEVITDVLKTLFDTLVAYDVDVAHVILKSSMALPGKESGVEHSPKDIAASTLAAFEHSVPDNVGGIVFLSGGQTPEQATQNLDAIAKAHLDTWPITFSYSRAAEEEAIIAWGGDDAHVPAAHRALLHRLALLTAAQQGVLPKENFATHTVVPSIV
jgi:fructose-bisphosphate aldolase, class I